MKLLIALDSFKGSLGSVEAGRAAAQGIRRAFPDAVCEVRPLADGGEGTVAALVAGFGGTIKTVDVTGPAGKLVRAKYGLLPNGVAVLEMAEAAGITLVSGAEKDPCRTTTHGVGEMIRDAMQNGAKEFIVGIGGSATNDAGAGMLQALGWRLLDAAGRDLPRGGAALARLAKIIPPPPSTLSNLSIESRSRKKVDSGMFTSQTSQTIHQSNNPTINFRIACDVTNPLCGPHGASAVFGPQKGATPAMVAELDAALAHFASVAGKDASFPGCGAAGGLGYAFRSFLNAELVPGVDLILQATHLEDEIRDADIVVTGEGRLDGQTVMGKAPIGVARLAKKHGKRVVAFCGCVGDGVEAVHDAGIDAYFPILRTISTLSEALDVRHASANLTATAEQAFRMILCSQPLAH